MKLLNINFKYVGQGDGIVIEFGENADQLGIIDANRCSGKNPVLEHLKEKQVERIKFLFITHFHEDHYSGVEEILDHCIAEEIKIQVFGFTTSLNKDVMKALKMSKDKKTRLSRMYMKAYDLSKEDATPQIIEHRTLLNIDSKSLKLDESYSLKFLSPSIEEIEKYERSALNQELMLKDRVSANVVSLVTMIESLENYILFTSDIEVDSLRRIGKKILAKADKKIMLGQIPHHGSIDNHNLEFWRRLKYDDNTPLVISVGPNSYDHPSDKVISELSDLNYKIEFTSSGFRSMGSDLDIFAVDVEPSSTSSNDNGIAYTF